MVNTNMRIILAILDMISWSNESWGSRVHDRPTFYWWLISTHRKVWKVHSSHE